MLHFVDTEICKKLHFHLVDLSLILTSQEKFTREIYPFCRNLRERYENELNELESSERAARTRYLEMKSVLAQKEEEIVYLRARLHTQDLELCELQHVSVR